MYLLDEGDRQRKSDQPAARYRQGKRLFSDCSVVHGDAVGKGQQEQRLQYTHFCA